MDSKTQHGYLVLADITGFTSYLAKVELEHAHEILTDLLETIVSKFKLILTISKLEGDAVFAYAPEVKVPSGEVLVNLIESTYVDFRKQRDIAKNNTTCTCNACSAIPSLDLKFFIHHGNFIIQTVSGIRELVGSDVNLVHRLMKNRVTESTGWMAYALFTEAGYSHIDIPIEGLHEQIESYEHLGDIRVYCLDLHERYKLIKESSRIFVTEKEADLKLFHEFPAPPPVIWEWFTNTDKKTLVSDQTARFTAMSRPGGRNAPGASNHCAHGKNLKNSSIETVLDWRPFEYFTIETVEGKMVVRETLHFEPIGDGSKTRLQIYAQVPSMKLPGWVKRPMLDYFYGRIMQKVFQNMKDLMQSDASEADFGPQSQQAA